MGALRISNYVSTDTNEYYYINSIIMSALLSCTFEKKNNVCIAQIGFQDLVKRFDGFGLSGYCLNILQTTKLLNNVALAGIRKIQQENLSVHNGFIEQAHLFMLTVDLTKYSSKMETTKLST